VRSGSGLQIGIGAAVLAVLCSCAVEPKVAPAPAPPAATQMTGYLRPAERPSGVLLLPPPPATDSAAAALDAEENRRYLALRGTPRWELATEDAVLDFPAAAATFDCALEVQVNQQSTPRLYNLLRRTLIDAGRSTAEAKARYQRQRPFMVNQQPLCSPQREDALRKDGSYPSGHSAVGWAWALVLAEVAPDRTDAILARGRAFGDSRLVCNVHWYSDVEAGRTMAAATVARLHASSEFRDDVAAATSEVLAARGKGLVPTRDCTTQAKVLAAGPPSRAPPSD
jgi:acid phosphatase (class A)